MNALIGSGRKPPLGGLTARPGHMTFRAHNCPRRACEWDVEPAIVTSFQVYITTRVILRPFLLLSRVGDVSSCPGRRAWLGAVPCTPTGVRLRVTLPTTFLEFVLGRRWRRFSHHFNDEDLAIVCGACACSIYATLSLPIPMMRCWRVHWKEPSHKNIERAEPMPQSSLVWPGG